jgi:hypothetical protein
MANVMLAGQQLARHKGIAGPRYVLVPHGRKFRISAEEGPLALVLGHAVRMAGDRIMRGHEQCPHRPRRNGWDVQRV